MPGGAQGSTIPTAEAGQAEAVRRGARLPEAFWWSAPAPARSPPQLLDGADAWEDMSVVDLRKYTAYVRSLGPPFSQKWLSRVGGNPAWQ